jgi:hypothetical protein
MTRSIKKLVLLSAASLISLSLKAQFEDRVITDKHDTIACKLSRSMMGAYKYKTAKDDAIKVDMGNIREYYTGNKKLWVRRVYITSSRVPCFVDVVITGKLNLYEMSYKNAYYDGYLTYSSTSSSLGGGQPRSKTQYFVAKSDTAEVVLDDDLSRSRSQELLEAKLVPFIQDNKSVYDQYQAEKRVNPDGLKKLVEMYNSGK